MKGTILHLDERDGQGIISGADGARYAFSASDLRGSGQIARPGVAVDFQPDGLRAVEIYPDPAPAAAAPALLGGEKNRFVAGILALTFGWLGAHKFYLGYRSAGIIMLLASIFGWLAFFVPTWIVGVIAFVEGVIYLTRSDAEFAALHGNGERPWF